MRSATFRRWPDSHLADLLPAFPHPITARRVTAARGLPQMKGFDIRAVSLASSLQWARGEIHDTALDTSRGEIVFWNELLEIGSYRTALTEIKRLNCPAMIVHACNPIVWKKLEREKSVCTFTEKIVWRDSAVIARRYVVPPVAFRAWVAKWS